MAIRGKSTLLSGWTVEDLQSLDPVEFMEMSLEFQVQAVSRLASAANKRLKRIEAAGLAAESVAYREVMADGKFSVKGKAPDELKTEYMRITRFFKRSTSSVKGTRDYVKQVNKLLEDMLSGDIPKEDIYTMSDVVIKLINQVADNFPGALHNPELYQTIKDKIVNIASERSAWTYSQFVEAYARLDQYVRELIKEYEETGGAYRKKAEQFGFEMDGNKGIY